MSFKKPLSYLVAAAVTVAITLPVSESRAQGANEELKLEEVTVTARKREESLQDVPLSITAFSADAIEKANIYDVRDVVRLSPNVVLQTTGGNGTGRFMPNLTFRGLQPSVPLPRSQTGAVFVDGNYVLGGVNAINTNDVERIEVLLVRRTPISAATRSPARSTSSRATLARRSRPKSICKRANARTIPSTAASKGRWPTG